ncbi:MAG: two-component regulator propeller domain-containing protein [Bacteroidota bacterium]
MLAGVYSHAQQLNFKDYTIENGLSSNFLYKVIQDRKGFIWVCSEAGITSFDGRNFLNYTTESGLQDNEILKIYEDSQGRLWYVTLKGKIGYISNGKVYASEKLNALINDNCVSLREDCDGALLVGTYNRGLLKIRNSKIVAVYEEPRIPVWKIENHHFAGHLFTDCKKGKVYYHSSDARIIEISSDAKVRMMPNSVRVHEILRDFDFPGVLMMYTLKNQHTDIDPGLVVIEEDLRERVLVSAEELGPQIRLHAIKDSRGDIWVATLDGVVRVTLVNGKYKFREKYLSGKRVSSLVQDNEGNIWASTLGDGLFIFSFGMYSYTMQDGLMSNAITTLVTNGKQLYAGTDNGYVNKIEDGKITTLEHADTYLSLKSYNRVNDMVILPDGNLCVGMDIGLVTYKDSKCLRWATGGSVKSIAPEASGEVWMGNHGGLLLSDMFSANASKKWAVAWIGRPSGLYTDKDTLWFWVNESLVAYSNDKLTKRFPKNSLWKDRISKIQRDPKGTLWLASQGMGLLYIDNNKLQSFPVAKGLASNICNSFFIDGDSILWAATNSGISKISIRKKGFPEILQNIYIRQGISSNKISSIARVGDQIYAGTSKGLFVFDVRDISRNTNPPPIYITHVRIWDKDTTLLPVYELDHTNNNISIDFAGLSFRSLGAISYKYKMEGIDTGWVKTNFSTVSFPILPSGEYTFLVKCVNEDGTESSEPAKITFNIGPPYWQSWWFYLSITIIVIVVVFLIFNSRFSRLEEKNLLRQQALEEEQKALRAQMNPHFIFNALNSIQYFILNKDILKANLYLSKFAALIRRILENSKNAFISIYDEMETIRLYIEIEAQRFDSSFEFEISIDSDVDKYNIEIPPMIIQPYVENAIWHGLLHRASKGKLTIHLYKAQNKVICEIRDNGIGRQRSQEIAKSHSLKKHKSVGMDITRNRLDNISQMQRSHYSVVIEDLFDENGEAAGTSVELTFPEERMDYED